MARAKPETVKFTLRAAVGHFARDLGAADKSPRTVETYARRVQVFATNAATCGVEQLGDVTPDLLRDWLLASDGSL